MQMQEKAMVQAVVSRELGNKVPSGLRVFTFDPEWGLPTSGPFALKLLAWLRLAGIPYEQVVENDSRKGPKGKSPWVELEGERIGDSEVIIAELSRRYGIDLDGGLSSEQLATGHAWRRTFEEHWHQVLEWELFFTAEGAGYMQGVLNAQLPGPMGRILFHVLRRHFRKQLYARGIGRHAPDIIAAKGNADIDALAAFLETRTFLVADQPTSADAAVFGLVAPMVYWTMSTPVADHAKSLEPVTRYCDTMRRVCFEVGEKSD